MRRLVLLVACLSAFATTAAAQQQIQATLAVGYSNLDKLFDENGDRQDLKAAQSHIPIGIGVNYTFWQGVYGGVGLAMRNKSVEATDTTEKKSMFGLGDLELRLGWKNKFGIIGAGVEAVGKIDLGKLPKDLDADEVLCSDNMHGFRIGGNVLASVLPMLDIGVRVSATLHFERSIAPGKDSPEVKMKSGTLIDPALVLSGSVDLGGVGLLYGVDIGYLYRTSNTVEGTDVKNTEMSMLYLTPSIGVKYAEHSLRAVFAFADGDMMVGIPLMGENRPAMATVPFALVYTYTRGL
jgi:hypothetical protein